jgi:phosphatidylserine decarboxylase
VDVDEFAKSAFDYKNFNEFFYRALKPEARPIAPGDRVAVFPADGRHLAFPNVDTADGFYVKGRQFSLADLLDDAKPSSGAGVPPAVSLAKFFSGGSMLISRLCPSDYHRFHFPIGGTPSESRLIQGCLYSVNPVALRRNIRYLVENKRMLTLIESPVFGPVATVEVGATNVGSIRQSFIPGQAVRKGDEKGFFAFGGSCMITLFARGRIAFDPDIAAQSAQCIETYAKMGERMGLVIM